MGVSGFVGGLGAGVGGGFDFDFRFGFGGGAVGGVGIGGGVGGVIGGGRSIGSFGSLGSSWFFGLIDPSSLFSSFCFFRSLRLFGGVCSFRLLAGVVCIGFLGPAGWGGGSIRRGGAAGVGAREGAGPGCGDLR